MTSEISMALGLAASLLHLGAFITYNRQMLRGDSRPNAVTWGIWAIGATLNGASYFFMNMDVIKALLPLVGSLACIWVFVLSLLKGKLSKPDKADLATLWLGIVAVVVWWTFRSAAYANLLFQVGLVVSIIPTVRGVIRDPGNEKANAWFMWGCAYLLMLCVVLLRWQGIWQDMALPLAGMTTHTLVGALSLRRK